VFIVASFDYSLYTELAISELLEKGLKKEQILALPMELRGERLEIMDTIHHSDGVSITDGGAILATASMTLGVIYGFILEWGPIIWGLIGLAAGFLLGCLIDFFWSKMRHSKNRHQGSKTELIIMIDCREEQADMVKKTLWNHLALGVAAIP
jgi:hypothetical protein